MLNSVENDINMAEQIASKVDAMGGCAYFVGGCVRDEMMGVPLKDIDIEVHGISPKALSDILDELGEKLVIGSSFGVFGLRGYDIDIAMPRTEKATGRGHKDFEVFVDPFLGVRKAAERRDFTINAMMKNVLTGEFIDCFGGKNDLEKGIVRHVNDDSFAEDPLRVFRAAQFASRFGFDVAESTVKLCSTIDLDALPSERVYAELEKALIRAKRPSVFFDVLRSMDRLGLWFEELKRNTDESAWKKGMSFLDASAESREMAIYVEGYMFASLCCAFLDGDISAATSLTERLTSERRLIKYVINMVKLIGEPQKLIDSNASEVEVYKMFDRSVCPYDLILLSSFSCKENTKRLFSLLTCYEEIIKLPCVTGSDLINAGIKPSKKYSEILAYAHELHLCGVNKDEALKKTLEFAKNITTND